MFQKVGKLTLLITFALYTSAQANPKQEAEPAASPVVLKSLVVDQIWSAMPVNYCLLTHGSHQYVAYYDSNRNMAIAQRKLGGKTWKKKVLPSKQGWDSHNYITMAVDKEGYLHLSGNMHNSRLLYFKSSKPHDANTLARQPGMTGEKEGRVTYPKFMKNKVGDLIFWYRDGGSGNGINIYNIYDTESQSWKRLLDKPLHDNSGGNAYATAPRPGPDGQYHIMWVWRRNSNAATTYNICHAQSKDLVTWQTAAGEALELPIGVDDKGTIVDDTPPGGGLLNMGNGFGFDSKKRQVVTYTRYDHDGNTQAYAGRFEDGQWKRYQLTDWDYRFDFGGGGSIAALVYVRSPSLRADGTLALPYKHVEYGDGILILDADSLEVLHTEKPKPKYPVNLIKPKSEFPGMQVNWTGDIGSSADADGRYVLRWETLSRNRDRPRKGELPENGTLVLYMIGMQE